MASEPAALFEEAPGRLVAFRWTDYDVPFWARANSRAGRWNRVDGTSTQYWSLSPDASWAELIRHERLLTEEELDFVHMPIWVCRVSSTMIVDLRRRSVREQYGITEEDLIADDWTACQELGDYLRQGVQGVIAPCAALPSDANLTLFGQRRAVDWDGPPALASVIPATRVAIGRPPTGLLDNVRRPPDALLGDRLF